jgi:hypothetical protein
MKPDPTSIPLHDIHLPPAVSWWPLAPGWWLLLLLAIIMIGAVVWWRRRRRLRQWRVDALIALKQVEQAYAQHRDEVQLVNELSVWLRRVCVSVFPREQIAAVTGQRWLEALDAVFANGKANEKNSPPWRFDSNIGRVLIILPYQQDAENIEIEIDPLLKLCKAWLKALPAPVVQTHNSPSSIFAGGGA